MLRQVLAGGEIVEQAGARFPLPGLGLAATRQLEIVEQEFAQLPRRAKLNLWPASVVDLLLEPSDALGEGGTQARQDASSTLTPARSISPRTRTIGRSSVS